MANREMSLHMKVGTKSLQVVKVRLKSLGKLDLEKEAAMRKAGIGYAALHQINGDIMYVRIGDILEVREDMHGSKYFKVVVDRIETSFVGAYLL